MITASEDIKALHLDPRSTFHAVNPQAGLLLTLRWSEPDPGADRINVLGAVPDDALTQEVRERLQAGLGVGPCLPAQPGGSRRLAAPPLTLPASVRRVSHDLGAPLTMRRWNAAFSSEPVSATALPASAAAPRFGFSSALRAAPTLSLSRRVAAPLQASLSCMIYCLAWSVMAPVRPTAPRVGP